MKFHNQSLLLKTHVSGYVSRNYINGSYEKERESSSGHAQAGSSPSSTSSKSSTSSEASAKETPVKAAAGKHMMFEFISSFVDANESVKYAEVKLKDGKKGIKDMS